MVKKIVALILCLMMVSAGCANSSSNANEKPDVKNDTLKVADYKIVLLLPGPINDQSWNATNYAGLEACNEQLGTKIEYVESVKAADFESTFREYAERGYHLILAAGSQFDEACNTVAKDFKETTFCVVNGSVSGGENVAPIFPKEYEASFLAGVIAGHVTQNGKIGTIGGFPNSPMEHLLDTYEKTAVKIAEDRNIDSPKATRAFANSWSDVALGKQMTEQMVDNGVDTMFVYANEVGLGAIEAAKYRGIKFVGFSSDQNSIAPETVVASVVFDFKTFYVWAVEKYINKTLGGNKVHEAGIEEGIFKVVYGENVDRTIEEQVDKALGDFKEGKIDLKAMFEN